MLTRVGLALWKNTFTSDVFTQGKVCKRRDIIFVKNVVKAKFEHVYNL